MMLLRFLAAAFAAAGMATAAAQPFPARPITLVVPYAPGGGTDLLARVVAKAAGDHLGQQIVIDNRPGASAMIGTNHVAKAPPDGYTLLMGASTFVIRDVLYPKDSQATIKDFAPVALIATTPMVLAVNPSVPHRSLGDFVAHVRRNPGKLNYPTFGKGTTPHLVCEMMNSELGLKMVDIGYKGAAPAMTDLIRGEVQVFCDVTTTALPAHKDGRIRVLGIMDERRSELAPEIPTFAELGHPNVKAVVMFGVLAPANTPQPVVERLNAAVAASMRNPEVAEAIRKLASTPGGASAADFAARLSQERDKWRKVVERLDLKLD